eukprot:8232507-Prorocentrum_lima.AAC.1
MRRLGVTGTLLHAIAALYHNPEFCIEVNGHVSTHRRQQRGIRQGCPLSPYLFIAIMTVLLEDVYEDLRSRHIFVDRGRLQGVLFDIVLYADDTALISSDVEIIAAILHSIQRIGLLYGCLLYTSDAADDM